MANIKSAQKRMRQNEKRRWRNRRYISSSRTAVKKARSYIKTGDLEAAEEAVERACRLLDRAASRSAIHKNNAARRKSRLMAAFNEARKQVG